MPYRRVEIAIGQSGVAERVKYLEQLRKMAGLDPGVQLVPPEGDQSGEFGVLVEHLVQFHEQGRQLPLFGAAHRGVHHVSGYFTRDVQLHDSHRLEVVCYLRSTGPVVSGIPLELLAVA